MLEKESDIFEIKWVQKNIKSYKKLLYSVKEYGEKYPIVTVDDDIEYSPYMLELLMQSYLNYPKDIHCHRAWKMNLNSKGEIYKEEQIGDYWYGASYLNMPTGVGGILYPPNCFNKTFFEERLFLKLAPTTDDLWFWCMAILNNTKIRVVDNHIEYMNYIEDSQEGPALYKVNVLGEALNNTSLLNLFSEFPLVKEKLNSDFGGSKTFYETYNVESISKIKLEEIPNFLNVNSFTENSILIWGTKERAENIEKISKSQNKEIEIRYLDNNFTNKQISNKKIVEIFEVECKDVTVFVASHEIFHNEIGARLLLNGFRNIFFVI